MSYAITIKSQPNQKILVYLVYTTYTE